MHLDAARALTEGNRLRKEGRLVDATAAYRRACALSPESGDAHFNLGVALRQAGGLREAALEFRAASRCNPHDMDAVQNVVETLCLAVQRGMQPFEPPPRPVAAAPAPFTIIVCSVDEARLARMQSSFRAALGSREHEFIVLRDARSLCEAYERGLRRARHELVVLAHDDVELLSEEPFEALQRALEHNDVVGIAGSRLVNGPAVLWAGQPHLHGALAYPAPAGCKVAIYSLASGVLPRMQALDGVILAVRRQAALSVGFDAQTFDGFDFYDLDFTYRAHLSGLRIALTTEVFVLHASEGGFDEAWKRYAERFRRKFPSLAARSGASFYFGRTLRDRREAVLFHEAFNGMGVLA